MRPRKRDKETETKKQEKPDHELFIQAYESKRSVFFFPLKYILAENWYIILYTKLHLRLARR